MINGRYIFILVVLTLFLFGVSKRFSADTATPLKQASNPAPEKPNTKVTREEPNSKSGIRPDLSAVRVVTLYPAGSISVKKPQPKEKPVIKKEKAPEKKFVTPKKKKRAPKPKVKTVVDAKPPPEKDIPNLSRFYDGERPTLEVGYEYIGFDRYIDVMERVGRLFVLIEEDGRIKLGPEVSLLGNRGIEHARYAIDRPHLIADPFIVDRLSQLDLPHTAIHDRVVLMFNTPFDDLIWDIIKNVAEKKNLSLGKIMQISGDYIERGNGIFLQLTHAVIRDTLEELPFHRSIRVTL